MLHLLLPLPLLTCSSEEEPQSLPEKVEKKKEKRKMGFLELAAREFEYDSEVRLQQQSYKLKQGNPFIS